MHCIMAEYIWKLKEPPNYLDSLIQLLSINKNSYALQLMFLNINDVHKNKTKRKRVKKIKSQPFKY